jgi:AcrR family transcriptional regulator
MSVLARHVGMTRGMVQYYFPTLEDVLHASIPHLNNEWQKKYFDYVQQEGDGKSDRMDVGIRALWRLMQDPLHVAKQELEAAARSNATLREVMRKEADFDEAATLERSKRAYPDLARGDETAFRYAMDYTVIFLEGLSRHHFSEDVERRCEVQLDMLKNHLRAYWRAHGIEMAKARGGAKARAAQGAETAVVPPPGALGERERDQALALLLKAATILSPRKDDPKPP